MRSINFLLLLTSVTAVASSVRRSIVSPQSFANLGAFAACVHNIKMIENNLVVTDTINMS